MMTVNQRTTVTLSREEIIAAIMQHISAHAGNVFPAYSEQSLQIEFHVAQDQDITGATVTAGKTDNHTGS